MEPRRRPAQALRRGRDLLARPAAVVWLGVGLVVVQLAYRTWALAGGWFLIDDYGFLTDAAHEKLTLGYLTQVHQDHLEPMGYLVAWLVAQSSTPFNWTLATVITMCLQALADVAALVFLVVLAGRRKRVLLALGFYLFSAVTLPGFLWWCVAPLQVTLQLVAFLAMTFHVLYLRTRRKRFVALSVASLALGALCGVGVAFTGVALFFLSLYLSDRTGWRSRLVDVVWRQKTAYVAYAALFVTYLGLYLHLNPLGGRSSSGALGVGDVLLRESLGPTVLGGPWQWGPMNDIPLVPTAPPDWTVTVAWVVIALLLASAWRRHRATAWAMAPVVGCLVVDVVMITTARGDTFGAALGRELRYAGDLAPVLTLALAVLVTGLRARGDRSVAPPLPSSRPSRYVGAVAVGAALVGAFWSTQQYVDNWHSDFPARHYTQNVIRQSLFKDLRLLDQPVPLDVIPAPKGGEFWRPSRLFIPLGQRISTSFSGNDMSVLDDRGVVREAEVVPHYSSVPGPESGCGYRVGRTTPANLSLSPVAGAATGTWWSVGYLGSSDGTVELRDGQTTRQIPVRRGLHVFVFLGGEPEGQVTLTALTDTTVCVSDVTVGALKAVRGTVASP